MKLQIPTNFYEISYHHGIGGTVPSVVNTMACNGAGLTHQTIAQFAHDNWANHVMPGLGTSVHLVLTRVRNAAGTVWEITGDTAGGISGPMLPPNCAYLARKLTGLPGRKQRGRMYLYGPVEGQVDEGGYWNNSTQGLALWAGLTAYRQGMQTNNVPIYLLHTDPLLVPSPITDLPLEAQIATQRRRMR